MFAAPIPTSSAGIASRGNGSEGLDGSGFMGCSDEDDPATTAMIPRRISQCKPKRRLTALHAWSGDVSRAGSLPPLGCRCYAIAMSQHFIDHSNTSAFPFVEGLRRGILTPPSEVIEAVAKEKAKFPSHVFTPECEHQTLNEWTVDFYFHHLPYEVLYRSTPQGPEVLAIGDDEIVAYTTGMPLEDQLKLNTYEPA